MTFNQHDDFCGITFTLKGTPHPQPRPRFVGGRVVSIASPKVKAYATALRRAAWAAVENFGGSDALKAAFGDHGLSLWLLASFNTKARSRHGQPHTARPDGDNIAKLAADCLMRVGAFAGDDSRIVDWRIQKVWGPEAFLSVRISVAPHLGACRPFTSAARPVKMNLAETVLKAAPDWLRR